MLFLNRFCDDFRKFLRQVGVFKEGNENVLEATRAGSRASVAPGGSTGALYHALSGNYALARCDLEIKHLVQKGKTAIFQHFGVFCRFFN